MKGHKLFIFGYTFFDEILRIQGYISKCEGRVWQSDRDTLKHCGQIAFTFHCCFTIYNLVHRRIVMNVIKTMKSV